MRPMTKWQIWWTHLREWWRGQKGQSLCPFAVCTAETERARAEAAAAEVTRLTEDRDAWREWAYRLATDVELAALGKLGSRAAHEGDAFASSDLVKRDDAAHHARKEAEGG